MLLRAHYLHATIYAFEPNAYRFIISQFRQEVANEAVQCWYDESTNAFHIECQTELAGEADEVLSNKIAAYVARELETPEHQEPGYEPGIRLLREARFAVSGDDTRTLMASGKATQASHALMFTDAEIRTSSNPSLQIELTNLAEIPRRISTRIIQPNIKAAKKLIRLGRTCRLVRWDEEERCYAPVEDVEDEPPQAYHEAKKARFNLVPFNTMYDERKKTEMAPVVEADAAVNTMEWLSGVEKTCQVEPGKEPEMPPDTKKLLVQQPLNETRARFPKGAASDEEDDDDETEYRAVDEDLVPTLQIPESAFSNQRTDEAALFVVPDSVQVATQNAEYPIAQDDFGRWDEGSTVIDEYGLTASVESAAQLQQERRRRRQMIARSQASVTARQRVAESQINPTPQGSVLQSQTGSISRVGSIWNTSRQSTPTSQPASERPAWENRVVQPDLHIDQQSSPTALNFTDNESFPSLPGWNPLQPNPPAEQVVERLSAPNRGFARKRNTMRQKAGPKLSCYLPFGSSKDCSHEFCRTLNRQSAVNALGGANVEVHIGMVVIHGTKYENGLNGTFTFKEAEGQLNSTETLVVSDFFRALTTSDTDALYIHNCWNEIGRPTPESHYEIHFRRADGNMLITTVDGTDKAKVSAHLPGHVKAEVCVHYPTHVWDARILVKDKISAQTLDDDLQYFITSMETIEQTPSFKAAVKGGHFPVAVYAKRVYTLDRDGTKFKLSQVHGLRLQNVGDEHHNFAAYVDAPPWWEVAVVADGVGDFAVLKGHVDELVTLVDCVGRDNEGIQIKKKKKQVDPDSDYEREYYQRSAHMFQPTNKSLIMW